MLIPLHYRYIFQIETNCNTALTLACFQGRCDVVKILIEHEANIEHRSKTGLTPLMEAVSGGHCNVSKITFAQFSSVLLMFQI